MILTTLSEEDYNQLLEIQKTFPALTFEHEPYQEWIPSTFTDKDIEALKQVKEILRKAITGFKNFTNFFYDKKGILCVRFYYDWSLEWNNDIDQIVVRNGQPFTGVGYLLAIELFKSFKNTWKDDNKENTNS